MPSIFYETISNFQPFIAYLIIFALGLVMLYCGIKTITKFVKTQIIPPWREATEKLLNEPGYVPAKPTKFSATMLYLFCLLLGFVQVGPITVYGRKRLPKKGNLIVASNHVDMGDGASMQHVLTDNIFQAQPVTYPIARCEIKGLLGCIGAKTGAIAIFHETREGRHNGLKAMITALKDRGPNAHLAIFPGAELVHNERINRNRFKTGLMTIARKVARVTGKPVYIIPMVIHYKRDPRDATILHWLLMFALTGFHYSNDPSNNSLGHRLLKYVCALKRFRNLFGHGQNYGAIVVIGEPLIVLPPGCAEASNYPSERILPENKVAAMDIYVDALLALQQIAFSKCMPWQDSECTCAKLSHQGA